MHKRQIYIVSASGNWNKASSYFKIHPYWWRISLSARGITALHIAVIMEQTSFVQKLVECMDVQDLEICMADRNTAFCLAAISGNKKIAEILFGKNPRLLWIRGQKDMLPIQLASSAGHIKMTEFLFQKTEEDLHNILPFQDVVKLFFSTITNSIYTVTSKLLNRDPKLLTIKNERELTPLQMLAQFSLCKETIGHQDIVSSLFKGMQKEKKTINSVELSKAMFDAAQSGNVTILEFLFNNHPDLLFEVDSTKQRSLLHIAILYRQEYVYRLILSKGAFKNVMIQLIDSDGNNVLHLAAEFDSKERLGLPSLPVLMCSEEKWFQEVEKIVPPAMKRMKNNDGLTPKEVYYRSHKDLHTEAASIVKNLANTLLVVAILIVTLGITGAITVPIKDLDSTSSPFFPKKTWYTFFFLSIAFGTWLCASSMFCYASVILPQSLQPKDESARVRQKKMVIGSVSLFVSILVMYTAAISGAIVVFDFLSNWSIYLICGFGGITFVLHIYLDYTLWYQVVKSALSFFQLCLSEADRILMAKLQDL
ncbi:hypothetical protein AAZX31_13G208000 [Glycine max]|nr:uncharacterized protein LOC114375855 [Glycine soja]XP_040864241.1 uncharacterized protein LOC102666517 isoform X2 [Glycine max]XP_040864242.1 uncharacterized protein LOC102666517 isoform X2 [Glycine max]KAG4384158.1 hypothetical protein GLYMA_13G226200v4 [Glycine max]KAG4384159.1 hypothetical protein GLYMA_13G226200v4 [Glycine max]KAG4384160.1 hypothetical protein GLYMA_13G226200v4 [Glycine max]KAG4384161.1 hypothetical protein GLYMA_13G226200v4 [Glycine max]KAG4384162.1 hypothetical prot